MTKLERWIQLSKDLKRIKEEEMALRKEICGAMLDGKSLPHTEKIEHEGLLIKAKGTLSYTVDEAVLKASWDELSPGEKDAIKWKPSVVMASYKKLPETSLLQESIITKPAAPTLTVEEV